MFILAVNPDITTDLDKVTPPPISNMMYIHVDGLISPFTLMSDNSRRKIWGAFVI